MSATKQFRNTKKRSIEKESFNDLNWDLIEQKRGMD